MRPLFPHINEFVLSKAVTQLWIMISRELSSIKQGESGMKNLIFLDSHAYEGKLRAGIKNETTAKDVIVGGEIRFY